MEYAALTQAAQKLWAALFAEDHIAAFGYVWGREENIGISVRKAEKAMQTAKKKFYALTVKVQRKCAVLHALPI